MTVVHPLVDQAMVSLDRRAVVVIFHQQFLVRRILTEDDKITLQPDNQALVDIVAAVDEIEIWGVVTYAVRMLIFAS